jgi:hypothetical protein
MKYELVEGSMKTITFSVKKVGGGGGYGRWGDHVNNRKESKVVRLPKFD